MLNELFVDIAYAQSAKSSQPGIIDYLIMPAAIFVIMYLLVIRPQQKKQKDLANLLEALKVGDEVVTSGGIIGRVKSVADSFVTLEVGTNTSLKIQKSHISGNNKPPVKAEAK